MIFCITSIWNERWLVAGCFTQIIKMHQVTKLWVLNIGILIYISLTLILNPKSTPATL